MPDIRSLFHRFHKQPVNRARNLTMRQVLSVTKTRYLPTWKQWKQLPSVLSRKEKQTVIGALCLIILCFTLLVGGYIVSHRVDIPAVGGEYTEGLVGEPQFINPLYAIGSDVDQDLTSLIYSGLVRWDPEEGFIPDLAESLEINEDGTAYTLKIRDNAKFHNGEDVRARDVLFTINAIQNPVYRSPLADHFYNVTVVQEDDKTVSFILEEAFVPFIQYLTVGILPASVWAEILPQNAPLAALNLQPIGSGPYRFAEFTKDKRGSIRSYTLKRNSDYYREPPFIERLTFKFYPDTLALHDALQNKNVEGASFVPFEKREETIENKNVELLEPFLPRVSVLYMNQDVHPALKDPVIRQAIAASINKTSLVEEVYGESARVIHGPILEGQVGYHQERIDVFDPASAASKLEEAGYTLVADTGLRKIKGEAEEQKDEEDTGEEAEMLRMRLTTVDSADAGLIAEKIREDLLVVGIEIDLVVVSSERMTTQVVETRDFDLLLSPTHLEADPDPYPFWHSSQAKESGLNLTGYANEEVDTLLEQARQELNEEVRAEHYRRFQEILATDTPAVYLYQSSYGYAIGKKISHPELLNIINPSDRFADVTQWYIKTKKALR